MISVGAYEAKTHLSALLDRVAHGEGIAITRHGTPVAGLVPPDTGERPSAGEVIAQIREFRKDKRLRGLSIRKMIEEGRR
jgi:prevent-host-death family protein